MVQPGAADRSGHSVIGALVLRQVGELRLFHRQIVGHVVEDEHGVSSIGRCLRRARAPPERRARVRWRQ